MDRLANSDSSVVLYCRRDLNNLPFIADQLQKPRIGPINLPFFKIFHRVPRKNIAKALYTRMYTSLAE